MLTYSSKQSKDDRKLISMNFSKIWRKEYRKWYPKNKFSPSIYFQARLNFEINVKLRNRYRNVHIRSSRRKDTTGAKTLPQRHFRAIWRHRGACSVSLTDDNLCKPAPAKRVVETAIVILSNICRAWTMYMCMDSGKYLLRALSASISWGRYYFVINCRPIRGRFYEVGRF